MRTKLIIGVAMVASLVAGVALGGVGVYVLTVLAACGIWD